MLLWTIYVLVGAIGLMLLGVLLRETWRARERRNFDDLKTACIARMQVMLHLESEDLAAQLQASFPLPVIEKCLEEIA